MGVGCRRIPTTVVGFCFTPLVIFSYEPNAGKIFSEKSFFFFSEKMISLKIFYDEKHFTSKQMK
jgi:hypothetical protein